MRVNHGVKKSRPVWRAALAFSRCVYFLVTILTNPTTRGLSFVRRRTIIRARTISSRCIRYISGFLSNKKAARLGGFVFLSWCSYFTLTAAIPTVNWSLRIRTEIITIRTRLVSMVCMTCLRFRPIIGLFVNKSRAKRCNFMLFTQP
jgi:hypothetical protein